MKERLQKVLAWRGVSSRRAAEDLIAAGEVTVNGRTAVIGDSVDPDADVILVGGWPVGRPARMYLALHKPRGYVSSVRRTHGEATVLDLVPVGSRVYPVGRLDKDTSGLLLLSNDGEWANVVAHPRYRVEKEYLALVRGTPSAASLRRLREGVALPDGGTTAPATVVSRGRVDGDTLLSITVIQGKKRQIRLMAEAMGNPVITLSRVRIGPLKLGDLPEGEWRHLESEEVESIRRYGRANARRDRGADTSADRH